MLSFALRKFPSWEGRRGTAVELRNQTRRFLPVYLPLSPSEGGEGWGEEVCLYWISPHSGPLPARASQGEGEDGSRALIRLIRHQSGAVGVSSRFPIRRFSAWQDTGATLI